MQRKQRILRIFLECDSVIRAPRQVNEKLRSYPTYTIPEAALYIAMSRRTLSYWLSDTPRWNVASYSGAIKLLSFQDLAQSYVLDFMRTHIGLSGGQALDVLREARRHTRSRYPLLSQDIRYVWKRVSLFKPATKVFPRRVINLSQHGQQEFPEIAEMFATRVRYSGGRIAQVFPWKGVTPGDDSKPLTIDPNVMSGRLVMTGTRIPVSVIAELSRSGEKPADIAKDYRIKQDSIEKALRHLGLLQAA